ncbi:triphosphoribosyl-dephospho-CoA synthase CitG [Pragia fontium]|uniref:Probable 2-(5''-triphosphoribosyl)-3'-dephosphocoenzyme-A synthase n=1 Tax=Pragia fontium DSM 5563 = ATCC 49100 TaxID=1122977 RepID=A0AAJ5BGS4_9GAMM|nr:triphosphoribosyl-dephospho-CoA synthase CitG [Pragia fontium]SFC60727.1 triphosphoribosyl-dephospho-CoA synthase [Pragia fontium DSM 5563 = ATCC 49100]
MMLKSTDSATVISSLEINKLPWVIRCAELANSAMLNEVNLTPKPGLVDMRNSGAHKDMDLTDFYRSAEAIRVWIPYFIEYGMSSHMQASSEILCGLRPLGLACEASMFKATSGVNTHKGTIFSLGLLATAMGRLVANQRGVTQQNLCYEVEAMSRGLVKRELEQNNQALTAGQRLYQQYGLTGARGEAESGFHLVQSVSLPIYQRLIAQGVDPQRALLQALLSLMAVNGDTNVASRGGPEGLAWLQNMSRQFLDLGGVMQSDYISQLKQFDRLCIERNLSPGGSADLLIVTWFLAQFPESHSKNSN